MPVRSDEADPGAADAFDPPRLLALLEALGVDARTFDHEPVLTVAEARLATAHVPGLHCKNLFLEERGGACWLVVLPAEKPLDLRALAGALGLRRLSFASPSRLAGLLGVSPGSVTPFAVVNDPGGRVRVVLDRDLLRASALKFHPLVNTRTTVVSPAGLLTFLEGGRHAPRIVDL